MNRNLLPTTLFSILVTVLLCLSNVAMPQPDRRGPDFQFINLEQRDELRIHLHRQMRAAWSTIEQQTKFDFNDPVLVVWVEEEGKFLELTGFHPENSAAAASASRQTIWINSSAWLRSRPHEQQQTMTHEFGHIVVGSLPGGRNLPLWANEGLVMHLANQMSLDEHLKLLAARTFASLPRLKDLEETFPRDQGAQTLAYRMSYAAVGQVAESLGDAPGRVSRFVSLLEHPEKGPRFAEDLKDPFRREGIQLSTQHSLGSRFNTGAIVVTSGGSIFLLISILFIIAYMVKRARSQRKMDHWEEEREPWEESLTDDDVQDIYGDREDRWG